MANQVTDEEKAQIASKFFLHSPPGEFNEVFNDVRVLLEDDDLLKKTVSLSFAKLNKDQYIPVLVNGSDEKCLITDINEQQDGQFYDPRTKQLFKFDHLKRIASDFKSADLSDAGENERARLQELLTEYVHEKYPGGSCSVFAAYNDGTTTIAAFIENHKFQPNNFWNGRWRSQWTIAISDKARSYLRGTIKVHVHYYEDGNIQLMSRKEVDTMIKTKNPLESAREIVKSINLMEDAFQLTLNGNYTTMSETTFKTLRRHLPVTKTKIDWNKILSYKVVNELKASE